VGALTAIMAATIAMTQYDIKKVLAYSTVSQLGFMFMAAGVGAFFVAIFHVMTHAFFKGCLFLGSGSVIHAMHDVEHRLYPHHGHGHDDAHGHSHGHAQEAHDSAAKVDAPGMSHQKHPLPYEGAFDAQDMRTMGGLGRMMPSTNITFLLATLAIAGIPLFSGFFSKDEILFRAFEHGYAGGHAYAWVVWGVGILTAFMTAVYMTRCYVLTFRGAPRWPESGRVPAHESPAAMTIPLWVLGILSVVGGFLGLPAVLLHLFGMEHSWLHHFLTNEGRGPVADALEQGATTGAAAEGAAHGAAEAAHVSPGLEWGLLALGAMIALTGVAYAWRAYTRHGLGFDAKVRRVWGRLYELASQKWRWDEFYEASVRRPLIDGAAEGMADFDAAVVDGAVNGLASATRGSSLRLRLMQNGLVQSYALAIVAGVVLVVLLVLLA